MNSKNIVTKRAGYEMMTNSAEKMLSTGEHLRCFTLQIKALTILYLYGVVADTLIFFLENLLLGDDDIVCVDNTYWLINSASGAWYFVIYTLLVYSYTIGLYIVFYKIPDRFGLISHKKRNVQDMPITIQRSRKSLAADDMVVEHMKV